MTTTETGIRIYVACLASYNNGKLHGAWIDLDDLSDLDDLQEAVQEMLKNSPEGQDAEEYAIHDYECAYSISEHEGLATVWELHENAEESGNPDAYFAFCNYQSSVADVSDFEEAYQGCYGSSRAFAEEMAESLGLIPETNTWPTYCIDWEWAARELMMDYYEENGHYFRNC